MQRNKWFSAPKNLVVCIVVLIAASLILAAFSYLKISAIDEKANANTTALQQRIASTTRSGYVALTDVQAGEMISEQMVEWHTDLSSDVSADMFITESDLGKVATISIPAGVPILKNMVSATLAADYHARECGFIWLMSDLQDNDFVDVRILFPNGEDYIVAAKKSVKNVDVATNNVFLWLTEEEIQSLDAAIVDANLHGAKIYVTRYVKPEIQKASVVTYEPNSDVMQVMASNPNIVTASARVLSMEARVAMEERLELFEQLNPGFSLDDSTGGGSSISSGSGSASTDVDVDVSVQQSESAVSIPESDEEVQYVE